MWIQFKPTNSHIIICVKGARCKVTLTGLWWVWWGFFPSKTHKETWMPQYQKNTSLSYPSTLTSPKRITQSVVMLFSGTNLHNTFRRDLCRTLCSGCFLPPSSVYPEARGTIMAHTGLPKIRVNERKEGGTKVLLLHCWGATHANGTKQHTMAHTCCSGNSSMRQAGRSWRTDFLH